MRYIPVLPAIEVTINAEKKEMFTHRMFLQSVLRNPEAFVMGVDAPTLIDLHRRILGEDVEVGGHIAIDDSPAWQALVVLVKRPIGLNATLIFQLEPFVRSVLEAPTEKAENSKYVAPELRKKVTNGAKATA